MTITKTLFQDNFKIKALTEEKSVGFLEQTIVNEGFWLVEKF